MLTYALSCIRLQRTAFRFSVVTMLRGNQITGNAKQFPCHQQEPESRTGTKWNWRPHSWALACYGLIPVNLNKTILQSCIAVGRPVLLTSSETSGSLGSPPEYQSDALRVFCVKRRLPAYGSPSLIPAFASFKARKSSDSANIPASVQPLD